MPVTTEGVEWMIHGQNWVNIGAPPPPTEVTEWTSCRQYWAFIEIKDITSFSAQYYTWWKAMQPAERCQSTDFSLPACSSVANVGVMTRSSLKRAAGAGTDPLSSKRRRG